MLTHNKRSGVEAGWSICLQMWRYWPRAIQAARLDKDQFSFLSKTYGGVCYRENEEELWAGKRSGRVAKVAVNARSLGPNRRATPRRLVSSTMLVDMKRQVATGAWRKLIFAPNKVVAAYTPVTSMFHARRQRRRDAELPR